MKPLFLLCLILPIVVSCTTVGPDYVPPSVSLPQRWHNNPGEENTHYDKASLKTISSWWLSFRDDLLSDLIERGIQNNLDFKKAQARLWEARTKVEIARGSFLPSFAGSGSATWKHTNEGKSSANTSDYFAADFDAGWELDIFGGIRRSVEAAKRDLEASEEELRDMLVSLVAEIGLNYMEVRTYQERIRVAQENLETQMESYNIVLWRYQAGIGDELALQQARYNMENTKSQIPLLKEGLEEALNRLSVLMGEAPGLLHSKLKEPRPLPPIPENIVVGVPADILRQRPDIRKAERQLAAQTARIGVAVSDLYPKLSLTGSIGLETLSLGGLPSSGLWALQGGPTLKWSIFKGGTIINNIELQKAMREEYLINYKAVILAALEEVENALVTFAQHQERQKALKEAVDAARQALNLASEKYNAGLADFSDVLEAQRSLLSLQDQLTQTQASLLSALVKLYKALGGGWSSFGLNNNEQWR